MEECKVLLVDDEEDFVATLAERLEMRGLKTLVATDGGEALAVVAGEHPHVVVLDVMMPGLGGLDVLRHLRATHPEVQVILLTGHGSTKEGIEGMKAGAYDYLMKPVEINQMVDKICQARDEGRGTGRDGS
jgi:DNA-binding response OmpR family regulator